MNKLVLAASICTVLSLAACRSAPQVQHVGGPNGGDAMVITCRRYADCFKIAGHNCLSGYDRISENKENPSFFDLSPKRRSFQLVISCKS